MSKKTKWSVEAQYAVATLKDVRSAFSRAGLYVTSLLLAEVIRVAEYELGTEVEKQKNKRGLRK